MPIFLQDLYDRRAGITGSIPYTIDEEKLPSNFPISRWTIQLQRYLGYWDHFTGQVWEEVIPDSKDDEGNPILRYPLQINYIKTVCIKQNSVLWGEVSDTQPVLAPIKVKAKKTGSKDMAKELEEFINGVWEENNGAALQQEGGLISQFLGGIVYKVCWKPDDLELESGIRLELLLPDFFLPVWETGKPDNLLEVWIAWRIPAREAALAYGYDNSGGIDPLYIEHWKTNTYSMFINDQPLTQDGITFKNLPNPFGFCPFVYIPRRRAGNYFGLSVVDDLEGLARELNARVADLGDITRETAQRDTYARNITNPPKSRDIGGNRPVIDLGNNGPGQEEPEVFVVDPPQIAEGLVKFPAQLSEQFSNDSAVPAIAYGVDEGSQRSALTLAVRFWPMTSEARSQRTHWRVGLIRIAHMIARMAIVKKVGGITLEHLKNIHVRPSWAPMIPRDTELLLNTVNILMSQWALDPVTALELLDFVDDPEDVVELAKVFFAWKAEQEAKAGPGGEAGGGQKPSSVPTK